jgi:hypothetical protein|tara:strand:+ start:1626 stop:1928 length:303 start_codon:yes stop_codon:yes gene_type:complete
MSHVMKISMAVGNSSIHFDEVGGKFVEDFNEDLHEQAKDIDPYLLNTLGLSNTRPKGSQVSPMNSMFHQIEHNDSDLDHTMKGVISNFFDQPIMEDNKHR